MGVEKVGYLSYGFFLPWPLDLPVAISQADSGKDFRKHYWFPFLQLAAFDESAEKFKTNNRTITITITLPAWRNETVLKYGTL